MSMDMRRVVRHPATHTLVLMAALAGCSVGTPTTPAGEAENRTSVGAPKLTKGGVALTAGEAAALRGKSAAELAALGMTQAEIDALQKSALANPNGQAAAGGQAAGNAGTSGQVGAVAGAAGGAQAGAQAGVPKDVTAETTAARQAAAAQVAVWLKDAAPMNVTAATGGVYRSADGSVIATIPPGALTEDTTVRVSRVDTSSFQVPHVAMPGIRFALDLDGARINPDFAIQVKVKADQRTIDELMKRDPAFTPEKYSLSQEGGAWYMSMPVNGPTSKPVKAPTEPSAFERFMLAEFGSLPLPENPDGAKKYSVKLSWAQQQFEANFNLPAPNNMNEWFSYEGQGVFDCWGIESTCWGMQLLHEMGWGVPAQNCNQTPASTAPTPPPVVAVDVPVRVTYTSDDAAVNGTAAAGATVRFSMPAWAQNGPLEVVTDANGNAGTFTPPGNPVTATAYINLGPRTGPSLATTAAAGMAPINLTVEKNSPKVNLTFTSDGPLGSSATVKYTLDGAPRTAVVTFPVSGQLTAGGTVKVDVPTDGFHNFTITDVSADGFLFKGAAPASLQVQRNGFYDAGVTLQITAPK